ncbi:MAG: glucose-6-phosphate dehydrogenase [Thermoplasmatota archaeon]
MVEQGPFSGAPSAHSVDPEKERARRAILQADPHLFAVFGATGDLAQRKLIPAVYHIQSTHHAERLVLLGVARKALSDAEFAVIVTDAISRATRIEPEEASAWAKTYTRYHSIGDGSNASYAGLAKHVQAIESAEGLPGNRLFYLALPAQAQPPTIRGLGASGLVSSTGWARLVVEKPFGRDLASARALHACIHQYFDESQVFRIDHFLGKETVQNLLVLRFANDLFESFWHRDHVDNVEITVAEELGVEHRAAYYESEGALRDMVQNHLTQLLTLTAMEPPVAFDADSIRDEKVKVLRAVAPIAPDAVVRGQYVRGKIGAAIVPGYREELGVDPHSATETFVALRLSIDNWRWKGVPFFLRTGKRLPRKATQIVITLKRPPVSMLSQHGGPTVGRNRLVILIQPEEGFDIAFEVKSPGHAIVPTTEKMRFRYADAFQALPDAYTTLLLDAMRGDVTLFVRADEVENAWRIYDGILTDEVEVHPYSAGSWGPAMAKTRPGDGPEDHSWTDP